MDLLLLGAVAYQASRGRLEQEDREGSGACHGLPATHPACASAERTESAPSHGHSQPTVKGGQAAGDAAPVTTPCLSRVLTLWFDYGHWPDVNEALVEGVKAIQIDTWLQVRTR